MPFKFPKFTLNPPPPRSVATTASQFTPDAQPVQPESRLGQYLAPGGSGSSRALRYVHPNVIDLAGGETILDYVQSSVFDRIREWTNWAHFHNPAGLGDPETIGFNAQGDPQVGTMHFDQLFEARDEGLAGLVDKQYDAFNHLRQNGWATSIYLGNPPYVTDTRTLLGWPEDISRPEFAAQSMLRAILDPWLRAGVWKIGFDFTGHHGTNSTTYRLKTLLGGGTFGPSAPFTGTWNSTWARLLDVEAVPVLPECDWPATWIANYWIYESTFGDAGRKQEATATSQPTYLVILKQGDQSFLDSPGFLYDLVGNYLSAGKRVLTRLTQFDDLGYDVEALAELA